MPADDQKVSILILAKNEEQNLPGCLHSVSWSDEVIVVVDKSSEDRTEEIARLGADLVAVRSFDDFASQRNAGLELASGDWILAIDADERPTPELAREVRRVINETYRPHVGYRVPIRSVVLGRPFRYSGTQFDRPLRLFRRDKGHWTGTVHETVELEGPSGQLRHSLQHRTIPDMATFLQKINHYTTLEAVKFHREGRKFRWWDVTLRPPWIFFKLYVLKKGFKDGLEGLVFCFLSSVSVAVRHWKHRELLLREKDAQARKGAP